MRFSTTLALLMLLTLLSGYTVYQGEALSSTLSQPRFLNMPTKYVTKWMSAEGEQAVETTRNQGETDPQHAARHKAAVLALQAEFPKVVVPAGQ